MTNSSSDPENQDVNIPELTLEKEMADLIEDNQAVLKGLEEQLDAKLKEIEDFKIAKNTEEDLEDFLYHLENAVRFIRSDLEEIRLGELSEKELPLMAKIAELEKAIESLNNPAEETRITSPRSSQDSSPRSRRESGSSLGSDTAMPLLKSPTTSNLSPGALLKTKEYSPEETEVLFEQYVRWRVDKRFIAPDKLPKGETIVLIPSDKSIESGKDPFLAFKKELLQAQENQTIISCFQKNAQYHHRWFVVKRVYKNGKWAADKEISNGQTKGAGLACSMAQMVLSYGGWDQNEAIKTASTKDGLDLAEDPLPDTTLIKFAQNILEASGEKVLCEKLKALLGEASSHEGKIKISTDDLIIFLESVKKLGISLSHLEDDQLQTPGHIENRYDLAFNRYIQRAGELHKDLRDDFALFLTEENIKGDADDICADLITQKEQIIENKKQKDEQKKADLALSAALTSSAKLVGDVQALIEQIEKKPNVTAEELKQLKSYNSGLESKLTNINSLIQERKKTSLGDEGLLDAKTNCETAKGRCSAIVEAQEKLAKKKSLLRSKSSARLIAQEEVEAQPIQETRDQISALKQDLDALSGETYRPNLEGQLSSIIDKTENLVRDLNETITPQIQFKTTEQKELEHQRLIDLVELGGEISEGDFAKIKANEFLEELSRFSELVDALSIKFQVAVLERSLYEKQQQLDDAKAKNEGGYSDGDLEGEIETIKKDLELQKSNLFIADSIAAISTLESTKLIFSNHLNYLRNLNSQEEDVVAEIVAVGTYLVEIEGELNEISDLLAKKALIQKTQPGEKAGVGAQLGEVQSRAKAAAQEVNAEVKKIKETHPTVSSPELPEPLLAEEGETPELKELKSILESSQIDLSRLREKLKNQKISDEDRINAIGIANQRRILVSNQLVEFLANNYDEELELFKNAEKGIGKELLTLVNNVERNLSEIERIDIESDLLRLVHLDRESGRVEKELFEEIRQLQADLNSMLLPPGKGNEDEKRAKINEAYDKFSLVDQHRQSRSQLRLQIDEKVNEISEIVGVEDEGKKKELLEKFRGEEFFQRDIFLKEQFAILSKEKNRLEEIVFSPKSHQYYDLEVLEEEILSFFEEGANKKEAIKSLSLEKLLLLKDRWQKLQDLKAEKGVDQDRLKAIEGSISRLQNIIGGEEVVEQENTKPSQKKGVFGFFGVKPKKPATTTPKQPFDVALVINGAISSKDSASIGVEIFSKQQEMESLVLKIDAFNTPENLDQILNPEADNIALAQQMMEITKRGREIEDFLILLGGDDSIKKTDIDIENIGTVLELCQKIHPPQPSGKGHEFGMSQNGLPFLRQLAVQRDLNKREMNKLLAEAMTRSGVEFKEETTPEITMEQIKDNEGAVAQKQDQEFLSKAKQQISAVATCLTTINYQKEHLYKLSYLLLLQKFIEEDGVSIEYGSGVAPDVIIKSDGTQIDFDPGKEILAWVESNKDDLEVKLGEIAQGLTDKLSEINGGLDLVVGNLLDLTIGGDFDEGGKKTNKVVQTLKTQITRAEDQITSLSDGFEAISSELQQFITKENPPLETSPEAETPLLDPDVQKLMAEIKIINFYLEALQDKGIDDLYMGMYRLFILKAYIENDGNILVDDDEVVTDAKGNVMLNQEIFYNSLVNDLQKAKDGLVNLEKLISERIDGIGKLLQKKIIEDLEVGSEDQKKNGAIMVQMIDLEEGKGLLNNLLKGLEEIFDKEIAAGKTAEISPPPEAPDTPAEENLKKVFPTPPPLATLTQAQIDEQRKKVAASLQSQNRPKEIEELTKELNQAKEKLDKLKDAGETTQTSEQLLQEEKQAQEAQEKALEVQKRLEKISSDLEKELEGLQKDPDKNSDSIAKITKNQQLISKALVVIEETKLGFEEVNEKYSKSDGLIQFKQELEDQREEAEVQRVIKEREEAEEKKRIRKEEREKLKPIRTPEEEAAAEQRTQQFTDKLAARPVVEPEVSNADLASSVVANVGEGIKPSNLEETPVVEKFDVEERLGVFKERLDVLMGCFQSIQGYLKKDALEKLFADKKSAGKNPKDAEIAVAQELMEFLKSQIIKANKVSQEMEIVVEEVRLFLENDLNLPLLSEEKDRYEENFKFLKDYLSEIENGIDGEINKILSLNTKEHGKKVSDIRETISQEFVKLGLLEEGVGKEKEVEESRQFIAELQAEERATRAAIGLFPEYAQETKEEVEKEKKSVSAIVSSQKDLLEGRKTQVSKNIDKIDLSRNEEGVVQNLKKLILANRDSLPGSNAAEDLAKYVKEASKAKVKEVQLYLNQAYEVIILLVEEVELIEERRLEHGYVESEDSQYLIDSAKSQIDLLIEQYEEIIYELGFSIDDDELTDLIEKLNYDLQDPNSSDLDRIECKKTLIETYKLILPTALGVVVENLISQQVEKFKSQSPEELENSIHVVEAHRLLKSINPNQNVDQIVATIGQIDGLMKGINPESDVSDQRSGGLFARLIKNLFNKEKPKAAIAKLSPEDETRKGEVNKFLDALRPIVKIYNAENPSEKEISAALDEFKGVKDVFDRVKSSDLAIAGRQKERFNVAKKVALGVIKKMGLSSSVKFKEFKGFVESEEFVDKQKKVTFGGVTTDEEQKEINDLWAKYLELKNLKGRLGSDNSSEVQQAAQKDLKNLFGIKLEKPKINKQLELLDLNIEVARKEYSAAQSKGDALVTAEQELADAKKELENKKAQYLGSEKPKSEKNLSFREKLSSFSSRRNVFRSSRSLRSSKSSNSSRLSERAKSMRDLFSTASGIRESFTNLLPLKTKSKQDKEPLPSEASPLEKSHENQPQPTNKLESANQKKSLCEKTTHATTAAVLLVTSAASAAAEGSRSLAQKAGEEVKKVKFPKNIIREIIWGNLKDIEGEKTQIKAALTKYLDTPDTLNPQEDKIVGEAKGVIEKQRSKPFPYSTKTKKNQAYRGIGVGVKIVGGKYIVESIVEGFPDKKLNLDQQITKVKIPVELEDHPDFKDNPLFKGKFGYFVDMGVFNNDHKKIATKKIATIFHGIADYPVEFEVCDADGKNPQKIICAQNTKSWQLVTSKKGEKIEVEKFDPQKGDSLSHLAGLKIANQRSSWFGRSNDVGRI